MEIPDAPGTDYPLRPGRIVYDAREAVAELFHAPDPLRVIFTLNATHAINLASARDTAAGRSRCHKRRRA